MAAPWSSTNCGSPWLPRVSWALGLGSEKKWMQESRDRQTVARNQIPPCRQGMQCARLSSGLGTGESSIAAVICRTRKMLSEGPESNHPDIQIGMCRLYSRGLASSSAHSSSARAGRGNQGDAGRTTTPAGSVPSSTTRNRLGTSGGSWLQSGCGDSVDVGAAGPARCEHNR